MVLIKKNTNKINLIHQCFNSCSKTKSRFIDRSAKRRKAICMPVQVLVKYLSVDHVLRDIFCYFISAALGVSSGPEESETFCSIWLNKNLSSSFQPYGNDLILLFNFRVLRYLDSSQRSFETSAKKLLPTWD